MIRTDLLPECVPVCNSQAQIRSLRCFDKLNKTVQKAKDSQS
jgi:hypothetical protein